MCDLACANPLDLEPLAAFTAEPLRGTTIEAESLPAPYHDLLVHQRDMTSTLESFVGQPLRLRVLEKRVEAGMLCRRVLLVGERDDAVVEFGAIQIHLTALPASAQTEVLACERPLGAILTHHRMAFLSAPRVFFRVHPDSDTSRLLHLSADTWLYGRRNVLRTPDGLMIADIVEVLPKMDGYEQA